MEELKQLLESVTSNLKKDELDVLFETIAKCLMTNYAIESGNGTFMFNEIEFYYYGSNHDDYRSDAKNPTRITYERTSEPGCWFIHNYGADITFKSVNKEYGGGILIRSVEKVGAEPNNAIVGPVKCVEAIWPEVVNAFEPTCPNPRIVRIPPRNIELNDPDARIRVEKVEKEKCAWRYTVNGAKVSKRK